MRLLIRGAGPAGVILALRAVARGWQVRLIDPRMRVSGGVHVHGVQGAELERSRLPDWPATYGLLAPEIPQWADAWCSPEHPLRVVTGSGAHVTGTVLPYGYRMLDKAALRATVDAQVESGSIHLAREEHTGAHWAPDVVVNCTGAPGAQSKVPSSNHKVIYQVAVGLVIPYDEVRLPVQPVFMDWTDAVPTEQATKAHHLHRTETAVPDVPSFLYVQPVEDGWLFEETILATDRVSPHDGGGLGRMLDVLESRLDARLKCHGLDGDRDQMDREIVCFPMGTRRHLWWWPDSQGEWFFGAAGGLVNPATGYSLGAMCSVAEEFLDALAHGSFPLKRRLYANGAWLLRRLGGWLIARADQESLSSFFDSFFRLPHDTQLGYLTGHNGIAVARAMWALRRSTGLCHPFLMPLWRGAWIPGLSRRAVLRLAGAPS